MTWLITPKWWAFRSHIAMTKPLSLRKNQYPQNVSKWCFSLLRILRHLCWRPFKAQFLFILGHSILWSYHVNKYILLTVTVCSRYGQFVQLYYLHFAQGLLFMVSLYECIIYILLKAHKMLKYSNFVLSPKWLQIVLIFLLLSKIRIFLVITLMWSRRAIFLEKIYLVFFSFLFGLVSHFLSNVKSCNPWEMENIGEI